MNTSHYFITGASGCIGHYLLDDLLQSTTGHLDCLIRNPAKLAAQYHNHPRITLHQGSLDQVEAHQDLVKTCDVMIHIATAWHDDDYSMQIPQNTGNVSLCRRGTLQKNHLFLNGQHPGTR